jgi:hypothetical protein
MIRLTRVVGFDPAGTYYEREWQRMNLHDLEETDAKCRQSQI